MRNYNIYRPSMKKLLKKNYTINRLSMKKLLNNEE